MGRADLIGNGGSTHSGLAAGHRRATRRAAQEQHAGGAKPARPPPAKGRPFTQHTGLPPRPGTAAKKKGR